jgi:hypothetical protein
MAIFAETLKLVSKLHLLNGHCRLTFEVSGKLQRFFDMNHSGNSIDQTICEELLTGDTATEACNDV